MKKVKMINKPPPLWLFTSAMIIVSMIVAYDIGYGDGKANAQISNTNKTQTINYAHDTHVARCYRCALGQNVSPANKDFCERNYNVWDVNKKQAKEVCK